MDFLYVPFSYVMKACVWISQNSYFFGLFFFALAFEIILLPLAIKQQKSQIAMAKIRPKDYAIRKKYAGRTDRVTQQKMQMEINEMHQQEGVSPFSGCLPLLITLPIVLILFAIVREPVTYSSNFTQDATTHIQATVEEEHPEYKDEAFSSSIVRYSFDYLDDIRRNLVKDSAAAKEANAILAAEQAKLGAAVEYKDPEAEDKEILKLENGFDKYALKKGGSAGYRETTVASVFASFGEDYVATLKEAGALPADYENPYALYVEENGEKAYFTDMMPNFTVFGVNLLNQPSFDFDENDTWQDWALLLIPILVFLTSFLSHKVTMKNQPTQTGPDGNPVKPGLFMTVGMPLMSTVFTLMMPAAIGCYWIWRTLLTMVKAPLMNKFYPIPRFTQEELDAAARELMAKSKGKKKKVITIEVDEDDNSYADLEVNRSSAAASPIETARPKPSGKKSELPYRKPTSIEMLSAEDDEPTNE